MRERQRERERERCPVQQKWPDTQKMFAKVETKRRTTKRFETETGERAVKIEKAGEI